MELSCFLFFSLRNCFSCHLPKNNNNSHLIIIFPSCIKNEGTAGRDTIYLAAPEDRAWSEGISRPGRCAHGDLVFKLIKHLDGLQTLLVSNLEGKNGSWYKNFVLSRQM